MFLRPCLNQWVSSATQSCSTLWPHWLQHTRLPSPSPTPGAYSKSCPLSRWCHTTISSSVVPFYHLQSFPASGPFSVNQFFASGGQSIGSFSFNISPFRNIQDWFPLGWTGWISLQSKGLSSLFQHHSSKASILRHSVSFIVQLLDPYMTSGKMIALNRGTFVGKVMSLLYNMLSRLIVAFFPWSKHLLISWGHNLQWFWSPRKSTLPLFPLFPHLFAMKWWDQIPWFSFLNVEF